MLLLLVARKKTSVLSDFFAPPPVFLASPLTQKPITFCVSEHSFFFLNEEKSLSRTVRNTSHYCQEMDTYTRESSKENGPLASTECLKSHEYLKNFDIFFCNHFLHRCRYNSMIVVANLIFIPTKKNYERHCIISCLLIECIFLAMLAKMSIFVLEVS